jgi:RNA-directed DNA polymerase
MKIPTTEQEVAELSMREAMLPPRVQRLRQKLSRKAKEQKRFRFYSLYDKIIDKETLMAAYRQVRANDGAPGVDGVTLVRIDEVIGEERFVEELHNELKARLIEMAGSAGRVTLIIVMSLPLIADA